MICSTFSSLNFIPNLETHSLRFTAGSEWVKDAASDSSDCSYLTSPEDFENRGAKDLDNRGAKDSSLVARDYLQRESSNSGIEESEVEVEALLALLEACTGLLRQCTARITGQQLQAILESVSGVQVQDKAAVGVRRGESGESGESEYRQTELPFSLNVNVTSNPSRQSRQFRQDATRAEKVATYSLTHSLTSLSLPLTDVSFLPTH